MEIYSLTPFQREGRLFHVKIIKSAICEIGYAYFHYNMGERKHNIFKYTIEYVGG